VLFYHIGRWIYIVDALDDIEEDQIKKNYNPIIARYEINTNSNLSEIQNAISITLENSCSTAASAAELIEFDENGPIIKNILYLGMPMTAKSISNGTKHKRRYSNGSI